MAIKYDLFNQDCVEYLKTLEDESVDHLQLDPPYNIGYDGQDGWDTWPSEEAYLTWCREWITECVRVLKPNRMLCIWGTQKSDTFFRLKLDVLNSFSDLTAQDAIHWSYNWGGRPKNNFAHKFETAWCYSKGKTFHFDADAVRVERKMKTNIRTGLPYDKGTIPTTIWEGNLATVSKEAQESKFHPTVKPQFVLERLIKAYTQPGELVVDCFSGSGSTAIAALTAGRRFSGSEISPKYFELSKQRIDGAIKGLNKSAPVF
jgi:adenine-specific DNA-methyltransferase